MIPSSSHPLSGLLGRASRWALFGLLVVGPALVPGVAQATTLAKLSTDQLTDAAEIIVRGEVIDTWTEVDANGLVWTRAMVEVQQTLKGPEQETLVISQAGGEYGGTRTVVVGVGRFSVGEDAVFFVSPRGEGRLQLVGMYQGKFTVRQDPYSRQLIVQRGTLDIQRAYDHRFLPLPPADQRLGLDALLDQVQDRVELGWDGQPIPGVSSDRLARINHLQEGVK